MKKEIVITPKYIATAADRGMPYGLGQTEEEALEDFDKKVNKIYNLATGGVVGIEHGHNLMKAAKAVLIENAAKS